MGKEQREAEKGLDENYWLGNNCAIGIVVRSMLVFYVNFYVMIRKRVPRLSEDDFFWGQPGMGIATSGGETLPARSRQPFA